MLTIQEIKNAKPTDKQRKLFDCDGLYLVVTSDGGKLWRGKYRVNGKEKTLSLGPYPKVGNDGRMPASSTIRLPLSVPRRNSRRGHRQRPPSSRWPTSGTGVNHVVGPRITPRKCVGRSTSASCQRSPPPAPWTGSSPGRSWR